MLQSASRKGYQQDHTSNMTNKANAMLTDKRLPSAPNLHPTWYIGDGLLLQPLEALFLSMSYCKMMLDIESTSSSNPKSNNSLMERSEILHSLESRGAHATSLRVLMLSMATSLSQSSSSSNPGLMFGNAGSVLRKNNCVLAERSLGGTESGLTSGNIDELMSVSFLLHLPKEMAFKVRISSLHYKAVLLVVLTPAPVHLLHFTSSLDISSSASVSYRQARLFSYPYIG